MGYQKRMNRLASFVRDARDDELSLIVGWVAWEVGQRGERAFHLGRADADSPDYRRGLRQLVSRAIEALE